MGEGRKKSPANARKRGESDHLDEEQLPQDWREHEETEQDRQLEEAYWSYWDEREAREKSEADLAVTKEQLSELNRKLVTDGDRQEGSPDKLRPEWLPCRGRKLPACGSKRRLRITQSPRNLPASRILPNDKLAAPRHVCRPISVWRRMRPRPSVESSWPSGSAFGVIRCSRGSSSTVCGIITSVWD